jgi:hypothetical protein
MFKMKVQRFPVMFVATDSHLVVVPLREHPEALSGCRSSSTAFALVSAAPADLTQLQPP